MRDDYLTNFAMLRLRRARVEMVAEERWLLLRDDGLGTAECRALLHTALLIATLLVDTFLHVLWLVLSIEHLRVCQLRTSFTSPDTVDAGFDVVPIVVIAFYVRHGGVSSLVIELDVAVPLRTSLVAGGARHATVGSVKGLSLNSGVSVR